MRIARFDSGLRYGDPNLRWGSPSYILEPGDPGYVPPPETLSQPQPRKKKAMPKSDYLQKADELFGGQLNTFKLNIGNYATAFSLTAPQIAAQAADADYFNYVIACQASVQNGAEQWTAWKKLTREGGEPPATGTPMPPTFPTAVPATAPGVEVRFRALVKQLKAHGAYNEAVGTALGIEGAEITGPDVATLQPELKLSASGDMVKVGWGWQGYRDFLDQCEIQVDRGGAGGWELLAIDTTPNYLDTAPVPAAPAKWKYRAIYRVDDARVGQWSGVEEIVVGG